MDQQLKSLKKRFSYHKSNFKRYKNNKHTHTSVFDIFDQFGFENCSIHLLEEVLYKTKNELLQREQYHVLKNNCINKRMPGRSDKDSRKIYEDSHRNEINRKKRERLICNICKVEYPRSHKSCHNKSKRLQKALQSPSINSITESISNLKINPHD